MPAYIYKILHLVGIMLTFLSFGGLVVRSILASDDKSLKRFATISNGIGLFLVLLGGFGMMARYQYSWQPWIIAKIVIWVIFGATLAVVNRKPELGKTIWWGLVILGGLAAYLAGLKPGFFS